jgi:hypothetical protein
MSGLGVATLLGAKYRRLLLGLTDEYDAFGLIEAGQVLLHHVILALTLTELHHRNLLLFGEALHGGYEGFGHRVHQSRGSELVAAMKTKELRHATFALQHRHVDVEVHPVDALQLEGHMILENVGNALWYAHVGSGTTPILRDRLPLRRHKLIGRNCLQFLTVGRSHTRIIRYAAGTTRYILSV